MKREKIISMNREMLYLETGTSKNHSSYKSHNNQVTDSLRRTKMVPSQASRVKTTLAKATEAHTNLENLPLKKRRRKMYRPPNRRLNS